MQAGIGNSLTRSLWLWDFGHIKRQVPGLTFYETRWLWRHLCQQDTALCSRCQTAEWMRSRAAQKIDQDCVCGSLRAHPSVFYSVLFYSILFLFYSIMTVHSILLLSILSAFLQIRRWNGPTNGIQLLVVLKVNKYYSCYQTSWVWAETKTHSYFYCETRTQKAFMISWLSEAHKKYHHCDQNK